MGQFITQFNELILKTIINKQLITQSQIAYIKFLQYFNNLTLFECLIEEGLIYNDDVINILCEKYSFPLLTAEKKIKILNISYTDESIKNGYFLFESEKENEPIAINNLLLLPHILKLKRHIKVYLIKRKEFLFLFEQNFHYLNTIKAKYLLNFLSNTLTAKNVPYKRYIVSFFIIFLSTIIFDIKIFHAINNIVYFSETLFKISLFKQSLNFKNAYLETTNDKNLPIYTILIPLYKEEEKIKSILDFLNNFNYPKYKLDVKIIIENDDFTLHKIIKIFETVKFIEIINVPFSLPRTKPKALNYAMRYSKGEYVVIYDAEDRPDPNQLITALEAFNNLPQEYACVQARLNFYNQDENLLTKLFSIEYSLWFDHLLKGLSIFNLPVPLGGTSNHFKADILKKVGMWDAFNVTEDADLGIRLYLNGYKVHLINSYTLEESPLELGNWLNQRSRWIKGFIQTFYVFNRQKGPQKNLNFFQKLAIFIFIGLSPYTFYCLPWLLTIIIKSKGTMFNYIWLINSFLSFLYMYGSACYILIKLRGKFKNFLFQDFLALGLFPIYFFLHSIACYKALWEVITKPFNWNKTKHGISKTQNLK